MKSTIRVALGQFEFAEVELDGLVSQEQIINFYHNLREEYQSSLTPDVLKGQGITPEEYDEFIEKQLCGESNHVEVFARMSPVQKWFWNANKRALNRIRAKHEKK